MNLRKPKNHTVVDMYKAWCKQELQKHKNYFPRYDAQMRMAGITGIYKLEQGKEVMVMSYTMFRLIIETYNKYASEAVIRGHRLDLGSKLGYIYPACVERRYGALRHDLVATLKARERDPDHPPMFCTDANYCIIKWQKFFQTPNESVYEFKPAKHTMVKNFFAALRANPVLKSNYRYFSYIYHERPPQQQSA